MTRLLKQKYWHELFEAGIALKAFNSVWETAGGILLLTGLHSWLSRGFVFITSSVFFAERHEFLFHILDVQLRHLNVVSTRTFVGAYLLFHGIMNAFLAYNLYRAAADSAAAIAAYYAGQVDVRVGILSSSNSQKTQQFAELATALRRRAEERVTTSAVPFAGGVYVAGKEANQDNDALIVPSFTRELHEEDGEPE
jgi:uncharacterized membrane protein